MIDPDEMTWVVMAKSPRPGCVKTRLVTPGGLSDEAAADVAAAMLRCVAARVRNRGRLVLAVSPINDRLWVEKHAGPSNAVVDQGAGDLGRRMNHVWEQLDRAAPIAFLGIDSPDLPETALDAIPRALKIADIAVGPTEDGGYWTLAARNYHPEILRNIDWGSTMVYDSTCRQAATAGLVVWDLQRWFDVDDPADLAALRARLKERRTPSGLPASCSDPAIDRLAAELDAICLPRSPRR